jgi:predicted O-methyltransferase YrrM
MAPIDFVFVDGHHEQQATEDYCRQLLPHMQKQGVMVFDDIRWSPQMLQAWKQICGSIAGLCLDMGSVGIVLL